MITLTENTLKVLSRLFENRSKNFSNLAKETGMSVMGVLKIAKNLEKNGIVSIAKIGKSSVVQIKPDRENIGVFALAEKYRFEKFIDEYPHLKTLLLLMKEKITAGSIVIFGSYASGEAVEESDIDLLFIDPARGTNELMGELSVLIDTAKKLAPIYVTKADFIKQFNSKHRLYSEMARGKRIIVKGEYRFWEMLLEAGATR